MANIKDHVQVLKEGQTLLPGSEGDFPFPQHAESHEEGGYDELDITKIPGLLSQDKTVVLALPDVAAAVTGQDNISFHESAGSAENSYLTQDIVDPNKVSVAAGTGYIRKIDSCASPLYACDWLASELVIGLGEIKYVGVEYDSGIDRGKVVFRATNEFNGHTEFLLGTVTRDSVDLHILNNPQIAADIAQHAYHRFYETFPFQRADRLGGLIPGEIGTRNLTVSAGEIYDGLNEFVITAKDTSGSDTFDAYYNNGSWVALTGQTQWDNTQYNDFGVGLVTLPGVRWGIHWIYLDLDDELVTVYGQDDYLTEGEAVAAAPPTTLPNRLLIHGKLIGRLIFQKNAATAERIESVFTTQFSVAGVVDHTELANIGTKTHSQIDAFIAAPSTPGDITLEGGGSITTTLGGDITLDPDSGGAVLVGGDSNILGTASGVLRLTGVSGVRIHLSNLRVDGDAYVSPSQHMLFWDQAGGDYAGFYGYKNITQGLHMIAERNNVILTTIANRSTDHGRGSDTDPTFYIFSATDLGTSTDEFVGDLHDKVNALRLIGKGGRTAKHFIPIELADDGYFDLPASSAGYGTFIAGDNEERTVLFWDSSATPVLAAQSSNVVTTDTDGNLCFFDNGTSVRVKNRLGAAKKITFFY
ncbi:hypothetical protein GWN42_13385, partial [candidate division KSB1 bacterium]|nr:hypothetical protein [candidate division KSB1 bacterium]